jgi:hypothetical protein
MKTTDEKKLEDYLEYRFNYLCEFMGFGQDDIITILGASPVLAPVMPLLVDAVYDKLFSYSATKRHFVPLQSGYSGAVPESLSELLWIQNDLITRHYQNKSEE